MLYLFFDGEHIGVLLKMGICYIYHDVSGTGGKLHIHFGRFDLEFLENFEEMFSFCEVKI